MSESTTLIKKAVLTSVGATSNLDRVKTAVNEAMKDLVKVGSDLIDELEEQGKVKTDSAQSFLKNVKEEATKKSEELEDKVSGKVRGAAKDLGFVSRREYEELLERLEAIEARFEVSELPQDKEEPKKKTRSKKSQTQAKEEPKEEDSKQFDLQMRLIKDTAKFLVVSFYMSSPGTGGTKGTFLSN